MPSLNFPTSPTLGQQYNDWVWNGGQWDFRQTLPGGLPAGSIIQWGGSTAPVNWLLCDGSAVSRTTYSSLFAAVGTSYGIGDGSTTFNLPDLRGRVPVGKNSGSFGTLGATGGAETVSLDGNNLPAHTHTFSATTSTDGYHSHGLSNNASNMVSDANQGINWATAGGASYGFRNSTILGNGSHSHTLSGTTGSSGSGSAHNNLQPYQVVNYIIKATAAVTPGESELAPRVSTLETASATTNKSGLVPIIPASVTLGAGAASVDSTGKITFTNARIISPNAVFSATYTNYLVQINITASSADNGLIVQFRNGTTVNTSATYRYTYAEWLDAAANAPSGGNLVTSIRAGRFATGGGMGELMFYSPYDSANGTRVLGKTFDTAYYGQGAGWNQTAERHDSFCLHNHASITITGTMRIFGVVN